jgi:hypothetical protein
MNGLQRLVEVNGNGYLFSSDGGQSPLAATTSTNT